MYKRLWKLRGMGRGKQMAVPAELDMPIGEHELYYDHFLVLVPKGTHIDEQKLLEAIKLPKD